jgi:putative transposase
LDHTVGFHGRFGAAFFITICCKTRRSNQLCRKDVSDVIFETAGRYHSLERWYVELLLLMPDHLHMLIGINGETTLSSVIRDFKRITARRGKIHWQRNFFDHRLRHDESECQKADYIRQNPVRAGLIRSTEAWNYVIDASDLEMRAGD